MTTRRASDLAEVASRRGATLIEVLVSLAIVALLTGGVMFGIGALSGARLRESSALVAGAIRVAYTHASATSRPTRLVFDIDERSIHIEDSEGQMLVLSGDRTGGAAAAGEAEKEVVAEAEAILKGPRAARAHFQPVKKLQGLDESARKNGKKLGSGIVFKHIEVEHDDEPADAGRVYLYFWPGGQTERAAIVLQKAGGDAVSDNDMLTVTVAALTGKVAVKAGSVAMLRPMDDDEASEREDNER